jgi:hypothetical protein
MKINEPETGKKAKSQKQPKGSTHGNQEHAAGLASARGSAAKNPVAYAASGVGVVIVAAIIIAAATRYGLKSDRSAQDIEEGFPLNNAAVHPIYA